MLKRDSIPTLTPELEVDLFEDYPEEVLVCEWNPALEQVIRLRQRRLEPAEPQLLFAYSPDQTTLTH